MSESMRLETSRVTTGSAAGLGDTGMLVRAQPSWAANAVNSASTRPTRALI